jgi:hypothetical protein
MPTPIEKRAEILSELWIGYRDTEYVQDLLDYGDIGFPLAFMLTHKIVAHTDKTEPFINELFSLVLEDLGIEDEEFDSFDQMIDYRETEDE